MSSDKPIPTTKKEDDNCQNNGGGCQKRRYSTAMTIFIITWALLGLMAFIHSIVCFSKDNPGGQFTGERVIGLILALLLGPFYYIFYYILKPTGYCGNRFWS